MYEPRISDDTSAAIREAHICRGIEESKRSTAMVSMQRYLNPQIKLSSVEWPVLE